MRRAAPFLLVFALLAACSPQDMARDVSERTAATVIFPVVNQSMPEPQARAVTTCLTNAASQVQLEVLMRDVGTRAGTDTVRNVRAIAARPSAQSCMAAQGLPGFPG